MILRKGLGSLVHKFLLVVGLMAAAENDVAVVISLGGDNCGMAELGYGEEGVAVAGSLDRVKRNLYGAVSAVLESDRAAQSRGELAVDLRAMRRPSLMLKVLSRYGSLMSPFQPTVVRGFSK